MMRNLIFYTFILITTLSSAQNDKALFDKALTYYNEGNYQMAADAYSEILQKGKSSVALYYNLANANYKLNRVGESIYYYEKALELSPNDVDVKNNMAFANQMRVDNITPLPRTFFQRIHDKVTSLYSVNTWSWIAILSSVFFALTFLMYFFSRETVKKRLFFTFCCVFFLAAACSLSIAYYKISESKSTHYAILFDKVVHVYSEPNSYSQEVFQLHEGTKVKVIETLNEWNKVRLADGKIGWAKTSTMKLL